MLPQIFPGQIPARREEKTAHRPGPEEPRKGGHKGGAAKGRQDPLGYGECRVLVEQLGPQPEQIVPPGGAVGGPVCYGLRQTGGRDGVPVAEHHQVEEGQ